MDTEKETAADVEESDEWFYNYFGRDNVAKVKEEGREEVREEIRMEVKEEAKEEVREEAFGLLSCFRWSEICENFS